VEPPASAADRIAGMSVAAGVVIMEPARIRWGPGTIPSSIAFEGT